MLELAAQTDGSLAQDGLEKPKQVSRYRFTPEDHEKSVSPEAKQRRRETFQQRRDQRKEAVLKLHTVHGMTVLYISRELGYAEKTIRGYVQELRREGRIPERQAVDGKLCEKCRRLAKWSSFQNASGRYLARCEDCR